MKTTTNRHSETLQESELVLNKDGSVYHLHLKPEHIADTVLLVGDQGRVEQISNKFDTIEFSIQNREFCTTTGSYKGKRITALSTGIGTDNIDIAINELDAAVNIDLENRSIKSELKSLNLIRIGTCGALQADIPVDSFAISSYGLGFDGLLNFYEHSKTKKESKIQSDFIQFYKDHGHEVDAYVSEGNKELISILEPGMIKGITATANGFYGPQGRVLRLKAQIPNQNELLRDFKSGDNRIINFEMETSGLYGIGGLLGHKCCTVCAVIANRFSKSYSEDYMLTVDKLIDTVLDRLTV
ncbi:nucleoside phosphorylase [Salibacteraceae bacterium]|nr:nucleoside phosphorylase [Salibacteraceae bacterium]